MTHQKYLGDNSPLRGSKNTLWEGGIRTPAFITGGYLSDDRRGEVFDEVMHATDWYPTLLAAAGIDSPEGKTLDGLNLWDGIQWGKTSEQDSERLLLLNVDGVQCETDVCGAIRWLKTTIFAFCVK